MSAINTPMGVIVCPQCSLPKLAGVYGYAGPQCQCWHPTPQPTLDVAGQLLQQSEETHRLRAELAAGREREARMRGALRNLLALDVDHQRGADDEDVCAEVREARAALAEGAQG